MKNPTKSALSGSFPQVAARKTAPGTAAGAPKGDSPLSLTVDLAHHNVERPNHGGYVGDQAAAAEFVRDREVRE